MALTYKLTHQKLARTLRTISGINKKLMFPPKAYYLYSMPFFNRVWRQVSSFYLPKIEKIQNMLLTLFQTLTLIPQQTP